MRAVALTALGLALLPSSAAAVRSLSLLPAEVPAGAICPAGSGPNDATERMGSVGSMGSMGLTHSAASAGSTGSTEAVPGKAEGDVLSESLPCYVVLPLASTEAEAERLTLLGLQEFLLGSKGRAEAFFRRACERDPRAMLPRAALLALRRLLPEEVQGLRAELEELMGSGLVTTPPEEAMLGWLLALSFGQTEEAQQLNDDWAMAHRRDAWSQCWRLLRAANYAPDLFLSSAEQSEEGDAPRSGTMVGDFADSAAEGSFEALDAELARLFPSHPLVCFCRAQVRERSADPKSRALALDQARRAAECLPSHPLVQLLLVHALDQAGQAEEAERVLAAARSRLYPKVPPEEARAERELWLLLCLRHCSLLSSLGREGDALKLRRQLNALPLPEGVSSTDVLLLRWESHFMPLRALLRPGARLTRSLIRAARRAAVPEEEGATKTAEFRCLVRAADGLEDALLALLHLNRRERQAAESELRSLEEAIRLMESVDLKELRSTGRTDSVLLAQRQLASLRAARYRVLMQLYPDQAEALQGDLEEILRRHQRYQLPPLIPAATAVKLLKRGASVLGRGR